MTVRFRKSDRVARHAGEPAPMRSRRGLTRGTRATVAAMLLTLWPVLPAAAHYPEQFLPNNVQQMSIWEGPLQTHCYYHAQHGNAYAVGYAKLSASGGFCDDHGAKVTVCQGFVCQTAPYSHGTSYNVWYQSTGPLFYSTVYSHMNFATPGENHWMHNNIFP